MAKIEDIEGVGAEFAKKLQSIGVRTVENLLTQGASSKGRKQLAENTGISEKRILEWVNRADLYRIKGIGSEYSDLLEAAGVDTVPELAQRSPENLLQKLTELQSAKKIVRQLPALSQVEDWVAQAKALPRIIEY